MTETIDIKEVYDELKNLRKEVHFIIDHMVDRDTILTPEEKINHEESLRELEKGETFSLEDIKSDRENA